MMYNPHRDYYAALGVCADASPDEIRRQLRTHLDAGEMEIVAEIGGVLLDRDLRARYDTERAVHRLREMLRFDTWISPGPRHRSTVHWRSSASTWGRDAMTKILVVDDSRAMREELSSTLAAAGFEVVEAGDGLEGLEMAGTTSDIALIILDLNMPRMDGLAFMEAMRATGRPTVATVMLTTEAHPFMIEKAKRAGAKGWLVKPVKKEHLVAVARRLTGGAASLTESGITFVVPRVK